MHHDVAYVIILKESLLILSMEFENFHTLDNALVFLLIGFWAFSAEEHLQVSFSILSDITSECNGAFSAEKLQFKQG